MRTVVQMSGIVLAALALGAAANTWGPRRLPWRGDWTHYVESQARRDGLGVTDLAGVRRIRAAGTHVLFDARSRKAFEAGRLPGAVSFPWLKAEAEFPKLEVLLMDPAQPALVYCDSADCEEGLLLARWLKKRGYRDLTLFAGGFRDWKRAGLEQERGP